MFRFIGKKVKRVRDAKRELDDVRNQLSRTIHAMSQLQICGGTDPLTLDKAEEIILDCFETCRQVQGLLWLLARCFDTLMKMSAWGFRLS